MAARLHLEKSMRHRLPSLVVGILFAALAGLAYGQSRSVPVQFAIPTAAELTVSSAAGGALAGQAITAAPGDSSTLTFSYRASKATGKVAIMVSAVPADADHSPIQLSVSGTAPGSVAGGPVQIAPAAGPVVLWSAGAGAHGLRQSLKVNYSSPDGARRPVVLIYSIAVS